MENKSTYKEILEIYILSVQEKFYYYFYMYTYIIKNYNSENSYELKRVIKLIIEDINKEIDTLKFMLLNEHKLYLEDVYSIIELFESNFQKRYKYVSRLFEYLQKDIRVDMNYRKSDIDYIPYAKGFSYSRIKTFFEEEKILSEDNFDNIINEAKILPYDGSNYFYGVYGLDRVILPKITNDKSMSIAIHELTHVALLRKDGISDIIRLGEDLPIFYELLFQRLNKYSNCKLHTTDDSLRLLDLYQEEPFDEQIKKLEIIKKHNKNS